MVANMDLVDSTVSSFQNELADSSAASNSVNGVNDSGLPLDYSSSEDCDEHSRPSPPRQASDERYSLEERVADLETKLAVLSRLLRQQQPQPREPIQRVDKTVKRLPKSFFLNNSDEDSFGRQSRAGSLSPPSPIMPNDDNRGRAYVRSLSLFHSESPAYSLSTRKCLAMKDDDHPSYPEEQERLLCITKNNINTKNTKSSKRKRNLSFQLLYQGEGGVLSSAEADLERLYATAPPAQTSMTPAERHLLAPQLLSILNHEKSTQNVVGKSNDIPKENNDDDLKLSVANETQAVTINCQTDDDSTNKKKTAVANGATTTVSDDQVRSRWLHYLNSYFQESNFDVDVQMQEFIRVPRKVEVLMTFGFFICLDAFLYMITILPIRFVWSCFLLLLKLFMPIVYRVQERKQRSKQGRSNEDKQLPLQRLLPASYRFRRRHSYQLIQVTILYSIYQYVLSGISIGKLYHWIRGQAMIKLYVVIAILEVFDRLFSSLGQDCLSSMYWNTVNRPKSSRMLVSVVVVWVYACLHALILFVHVACLNVAMNSADQALLTLLISGNFAEIKSTVFKKYNKPALFKVAASDICERFKLGLFLGLVLLLNICQGMEMTQFVAYLRVCGLVCGAELLADWIKHSFISKFNYLPSKVYKEFALLLAGDFTGIGHEGVDLDHSYAVVKRIGFAQIPLVCVVFRLLREAVRYAQRNPYWQGIVQLFLSSQTRVVFCFVMTWLFLLCIKTAVGRWLRQNAMAKLMSAPEIVEMTELRKENTKKQQ